MNIDLMRKIDRYIGVPLCYTLSAINTLNPFKKQSPKQINKILFIQISEMGSAVSISPAIELTKKRYPNAEIHYLMFSEMAEILTLLNQVKPENIHTINNNLASLPFSTLAQAIKLRTKGFDIIIDLELFSRYSSILSYLIGAKDIIGFNKFYMEGLYRGNFQTKKIIYNHAKQIAINVLACVEAIEHPRNEIPLLKQQLNPIYPKKITSKKEEKQEIKNRLGIKKGKIIILNPNASLLMPLRRWPIENYAALAKKLLKDPNNNIVLIGSKKEAQDTRKLKELINNERCIDFAGKTTLKELITLYNISDVIVSSDCGPAHFAALTDIKIIVMFGPENPACYAPLSKNLDVLYADLACSPCVSAYNHRKSACNNNKCMHAITVDEVYSEVINSF